MAMIELTQTQFTDKLESEKLVRVPTEHVYEGNTLFVFFFKSREKWDYFTIIAKKDIEYLQEFRINYCHKCMPVKESPVFLPYDLLDSDEKDKVNQTFTTTKQVNLMDFEDIIESSENYADFLVKMFDKMEKEVLKSVSKIQIEKKLNKNFGEFLANLFNIVNTAQFTKMVKKFLKQDVEVGRKEAEKELKVDIPYNSAFEQKLMVLYNEQIDGYTINGKKWFGIKGVTKEIQQKVIVTVQDGINANKSNAEIAKDVKSTFGGFTDWRSNMIARTETNRIHNESKLLGYKESGLEGGKIVSVAIDNRTSPICLRLHKKYSNNPIPLDDEFTDNETMKAFSTPPFHVNCRTTIIFRPF